MGESKVSRGVTAAIGLVFLGLAGAIAAVVETHDAGTIAATALVGLLGAEAVLAALTDRRSLLSRIGPLP